MKRQVIFRDRQELQAADLNNIEIFADETTKSILTDAITAERQFVGLNVTQKSATEIEIAPGRLYVGDGGMVYELIEKQTVSLFSYLPVQDKKWLSISVIGQEIETDIQPRDFLIDLQTGQTEPRAVAMEKARVVQSHIASGLESPDPQKPEPLTGYTLIAYVKLTPTGISEIQRADNKLLPNLNIVNQTVQDIGRWRALAEPRISTLSSDIANLASRINTMQDPSARLFEIATDVARLKEKAGLPSVYSSYSADYFVNETQSDKNNPEYYALVQAGLRFPFAAQDEKTLSLFNPYENAVKNYGGLIIPAHSEEVRIKTEGYAGAISVAQYQYQTYTFYYGWLAPYWYWYGPYWYDYWRHPYWYWYDPYRFVYTGYYSSGYVLVYDRWYGCYRWWYVGPYIYFNTNPTNLNGSQVAQTFLNSQAGWLTKVGLNFVSTDVNGVVYVHITETKDGKPDLSKVIGYASLNPSELKRYPLETTFTLQRPAYLKAGTRYAIVLTTAGNHTLAVVAGARYTQGTIFYSSDGDYFIGDLSKDLMMNLYFAKFGSTYTQVQLNPMSLSGGIANISLRSGMVIPDSCDMIFEYQKDGNWIKIGDGTADQLLGLPALLPLRVTMIGSSDIMPGLELSNSSLLVSRAATSFKHISTTRTLQAATNQVDVVLEIDNWSSAHHTCLIKLKSGSNTYNPTTVTDTILGDKTIKRTARFNLSPPINNYRIEISGSTTTATNCYYVIDRVDIAY